MASGTAYNFVLPSANPIFNLDAGNISASSHNSSKVSNALLNKSENNVKVCQVRKENVVSQFLPSYVPQSVLVGSLLEHLCSLFESNPEKSKQLFSLICKHLVELKIVSPVSYLEEYASIRSQYKTSFYALIQSIRLNWQLNLPLPMSSNIDDFSDLKHIPPCSPYHKYFNAENVFQFPASRYQEEFDELCELGEGAFGKVFKARNKTDHQEYAIKKIYFKNVDPENEPKEVKRIMREVFSLASLQHPNIVRYHNAWMEHDFKQSKASLNVTDKPFLSLNNETRNSDFNIALSSQFNKNFPKENSLSSADESWGTSKFSRSFHNAEKGKFWNIGSDDENDCNHSFSNTPKTVNEQKSPPKNLPVICTIGVQREQDSKLKRVRSVVNFLNPTDAVLKLSHKNISRSFSSNNVLSSDLFLNLSSVSPLKQPLTLLSNIVLFIQMQICDSSLQVWIKERNEKVSNNILSIHEKNQTFFIFRQILSALEYIHDKDILHRDLKPRNIFINGSQPKVLLGDFGLSRSCSSRRSSKALSPVDNSTFTFDDDEHTSGIGTTAYAAPEQLLYEHYNFKADMFSTGIILFELTWPLHTAHERSLYLKNLRDENIPIEYISHWKDISSVLQSLISHDPNKRPSASELLNHNLFSCVSETNSIVLNDDCQLLKEKISKLVEENKLLRNQLIANGINPLI